VGEAVDQDFVRAAACGSKEHGTLEVDRYSLETTRKQVLRGPAT